MEMIVMNEVRTRFAPSPTGYMHIGNLRTAIFEYLTAKHNNGKFILRIEDTDREREVEGATDFIYKTLGLCGFEIDEGPENPGEYGPYIQSERKDIYIKYAKKLVEEGKAYYCFCSEEELSKQREIAGKRNVPYMYNGKCKHLSEEEVKEKLNNGEKFVIRQAMPKDGYTVINDMVYGMVKIENSVLEDQILIKSDGYPTYNFANVIDDHLMKISYVIRGKEYLDQSAKYNLLYESFGWEKPKYIHVAMVLGEDGTKLSKRNGDANFMDLYNMGFLPEAIVNYLVLLGWSPKDNKEIFTMEELIQEFDPKRIGKSPSSYDIKKLEWVNHEYIKKFSLEELRNLCLPFLRDAYDLSGKNDEWINTLLSLYQKELKYGKEIVELVKLFFNNEYNLDEECINFMNEEGINNTIDIFRNEINNIDSWSIDSINNAINNTKEKAMVKGKMLFMPIRIKCTGIMHGPELSTCIYLVGEDKIKERLNS